MAAFWIGKSPPNLVRVRFLPGLLPVAVAIAVVHHPVVISLVTEERDRFTSFTALLEHWFNAHERVLADLPLIS